MYFFLELSRNLSLFSTYLVKLYVQLFIEGLIQSCSCIVFGSKFADNETVYGLYGAFCSLQIVATPRGAPWTR